MAQYNGTIDLISGIRPKNGGSFPLVDAKDVQVKEDGTRLDQDLDNLHQAVDNAGTVKSVAKKTPDANGAIELAADDIRYDTNTSVKQVVGSLEEKMKGVKEDFNNLKDTIVTEHGSETEYTRISYEESADEVEVPTMEELNDVDVKVDQLKNDISGFYDTEVSIPDLNSFTTFASQGAYRLSGNATTIEGKIERIAAKVNGTGAAEIVVAHKFVRSDGISCVKVDAILPVMIQNDGVVLLYNGIDFEYTEIVPIGTIVGLKSDTVRIAYFTDGVKGFNLGTTASVGDEKRFIDSQNDYNHAIGLIVKKDKIITTISNLTERVTEVENRIVILEQKQSIPTSVDYCGDFSVMTSPTAISNLRISGNAIFDSGSLDAIYLKVRESGTVTIVILKYDLEGFLVKSRISLAATPDKTEYVNGEDYEYNEKIEMNTYIGCHSEAVASYYGVDNVASIVTSNGLPEVGGIISGYYRAPYNVAVGARIKPDVFEIDVGYNDTAIMPENFRHYNREDETSVFAIPTTLQGTVKILHSGSVTIANGSGCFVDFENATCGFYKSIAAETDELEVISQDNISFALVANRRYHITQKKTLTGFTVEITDTVTLGKHSFSTTASSSGEGNGKAICVADSSIVVSNFKHISNESPKPKVLVFGDSWTAGNTLWGQKENLWVSRFINSIDKNIYVYCMGGASSTNGLLWIEAIKSIIHPKYVVLEFGVNEGDLLVYKYQMQMLINFIKNKWKAIPVLVTIPPTQGASGSSGIYGDINEWVKNSGELYIDMCACLTENGDGVTRNDLLFFADKTHPTGDGHELIFKSMQVCVPELFV